MNRSTAGDFALPDVLMFGVSAVVGRQSHHPAGVVELPGNFRQLVREGFSEQLGMVPDGLVRTLELDRLERVVVAYIVRNSNTQTHVKTQGTMQETKEVVR